MNVRLRSNNKMPKSIRWAVVTCVAVSAFMVASVVIPSDIFFPTCAAVFAGAGTFFVA